MPRKADVTAVAKLLQNPDFESPEQAAVAVIEALDAARRDRLNFVLAVQGLPVAYLYGSFENREEAIRWAKRVGLDVARLSVGVVPLFNKDSVLPRHLKMMEEVAAKNEPAAPKASRGRQKKAA